MPGAEVAAASGLMSGPMDDAFSIDRLGVGIPATRSARPTPKRLTPSAAPAVALNINVSGMPPHAPSLPAASTLAASPRSPSPSPSFLAAAGLAGAPPMLAYTNYGWTPPAWLPHPAYVTMPSVSELTYRAFPALFPPPPTVVASSTSTAAVASSIFTATVAGSITGAGSAAAPSSSASAARISATSRSSALPANRRPGQKRRRAHSESDVSGTGTVGTNATSTSANSTAGSPPPSGPSRTGESSATAAPPTAKSGQLCVTCSLRTIYCKGYCRSCYEKLPETKAKTRERHQRYNRSAQGRSRVRRFRARKAAAEALVLVADPS